MLEKESPNSMQLRYGNETFRLVGCMRLDKDIVAGVREWSAMTWKPLIYIYGERGRESFVNCDMNLQMTKIQFPLLSVP